MILSTIIFYVFAFTLITSSILVIAARNPVHSVLFLILSFFNAAGLFILLGAEFLAFILVIVYVGAVAVLFLFVVMMLDINFQQVRQGFNRYITIGATVGFVLLAQIILVVSVWQYDPKGLVTFDTPVTPDQVENTRALGQILYTHYFYPFQVSGLILLVAMIGAIVLTLRQRKDVRRQKVDQQMSREVSDVIKIVKVQSGQGVDV